MRKIKLFMTALALTGGVNFALAQNVGDIITYNGGEYKVTGENLVTNGSFDDGVNNWFAGEWKNASASNYTLQSSGGFDGGAYLEYSAGGASSEKNIRNRFTVETGKMYLFRCYTSGKTPGSNNLQYSKIWASADGSAETTALYQLQWGANAGQTSQTWKQNDFIFTATTDYIVFRSSWTENAKLDGFFLGEVKLNDIAEASDYQALNAAISTVENKGWGFDAGEYAPYNHVGVLEALAQAKAIDQANENPKSVVTNLTATLNNATWTANTEEVNAIWDPSFQHDYSGLSGNVQPIGWFRVKGTTGDGYNVRYMGGSNAGLDATSSGKALFTKFQGYYGWQDGYTMPLNENTYYTIGFIYGGWGDCKKDGYVQMEDPDGTVINPFPSKNLPLDEVTADSKPESWKDYSGIFKTKAAGDYVLALLKTGASQQSQYVYGDFMLKQTTTDEAMAFYNTAHSDVESSYDANANGGTEKTAFKAALDANMEGKTPSEIIEAANNLYTLRDAFVAATQHYNNYVAEKANAERINASLTTGINEPTTAEEAVDALHAILVNEYNYVKDNFNADAAEAYGITIDKWTGTATSGGNADTPQTNSGEKWGESATTYYEQGKNGWGSNAWTLNYSKTVTLPAGTYVLKVAARASNGTTATLKATIGETTVTEALPNFSAEGKGITTAGVASFDDGEFAKDGKGYGWQWRYLAFTLENEGEVTLQIDAEANSINQWCSFGDVAVVSNVNTEALETAYNSFTPTLGFQKDEYAPYNNVTRIEAYNQAKAIVEGTVVPSTQTEVNNITNILNTEWVKNANDVDAIYNGSFDSNVDGDWGLTGWTRTNGWGQQQTGLSGDYATAYYNQPGSLKYGDTGVYTMPLAANTIYKLTFAYRSHENNSNKGVTVSVLNGEDGLAATTFEGNGSTSEWKVATKFFKTGAAGNYVLTLANNGNTWMTGVSLIKAVAEDITISEDETYTPEEKYANVTFNRTTVKGWNGMVLPFDVNASQMLAIQAVFNGDRVMDFSGITYDEANGVTLKFEPATEIKAGRPFMVHLNSAGTSYSTTVSGTYFGVTVNQKNPVFLSANGLEDVSFTAEGNDNIKYTFKGTYDASTDLTNVNFALIQGNQFYYHTAGKNESSAKAFRAYFVNESSEPNAARISFNFGDGDVTTAISEVKATTPESDAIYNLGGQRVMKAQKGLYIQNGKKMVIK